MHIYEYSSPGIEANKSDLYCSRKGHFLTFNMDLGQLNVTFIFSSLFEVLK